ncbi:hypothetical protein SLEP1_g44150 [Rubroshorea leprosula]|uniref:Uncharacterized protein n=1 Tax=Rubroshorea leprosula TaxID=152421 RepID=A0AAV5LFR5_9ROSI|nr:hypothetical protein SLEP1_g44150 [Rubroshorea leprosula]
MTKEVLSDLRSIIYLKGIFVVVIIILRLKVVCWFSRNAWGSK